MKYRTRKFTFGGLLLILTLMIYYKAMPLETTWLGKDGHLYNLSLGLITGLVVLLFQFTVDNLRDKELEKLQETKIIGVLESRDKEDYYMRLIRDAKKEIIVFGVTASRFLIDFADVPHTNSDKKVLLNALQRGVTVKFLLADRTYLIDSTDKTKHDEAKTRIEKLKENLTNKDLLQVKYYKHPPTLSMVITDEHYLIGPVFDEKESRHTVTIHAKFGGAFARDYLDNFEKEWAKA